MSEKDTINLLDLIHKLQKIIQLLIRKWILVSFVTFLGIIIGLWYSMNKKPIYSSTLSFVVEGEGNMGGIASIASTFGLGRAGGGQGVFTSANILDLLKSSSLVRKALLQPLNNNQKKSFVDYYIEFSGLKEKWDDNSEYKRINFKPNTTVDKLTTDQIEILGQITSTIKEDITVEIKNPENTIISIDLDSHNETFSMYFPEQLIKVVSEYYIETKTRKAKLNYEVIKQQTDSVRLELNKAISGVASANDNTFLLNPAFNIKRVPSIHKEVNVQANQAILTELVKNLELSRMNLLNETPFIEIIDRPISKISPRRFTKSKGILIGGFTGLFLIIFFLIIKEYLRNLLSEVSTKTITEGN